VSQSRLWVLKYNSAPQCMEDEELVAGLQCGDARAVEYLVQQYAPALYRFAYYQLQDASLAEDLVSDVMVRVIGRVGGFVLAQAEQATFQAWLFRIARNLIADHYRARKRRPQLSLEAILDAEPGLEPGRYDSRIEDLLDREQLRARLATLTGEQREVILLHVIEGWELPQVARLLERSLPSVKSLYYRGVQSLRRAMSRGDDSTG
jgi:RNA polymerase sigma-70 factor (ECF subfamily)